MSFVYTPTTEQAQVIHADHEVLVVSKPSGLLSVPGRGEDRTDCLIERLRDDYDGSERREFVGWFRGQSQLSGCRSD